jgi:hypothetical protein
MACNIVRDSDNVWLIVVYLVDIYSLIFYVYICMYYTVLKIMLEWTTQPVSVDVYYFIFW